MPNALQQIELMKRQLQDLLPMKDEYRQALEKKIRLEFNYNSNHLEGNTLTYQETELLLIFDQSKGNHEMRELEEMKAHDVAYNLIEEWAKDKERILTEADIRTLNQIILVRDFWKDAMTSDGQPTRRKIKVGQYKKYPNSVQLANGEMFHYASPAETPIKMGELIQWYREEEERRELSPVALATLLHYRFVLIHPFDDGNGRISRLLMNYVLLKHDYPPVVIKSAEKKSYLQALHLADTGDLDAFIDYIAEQEFWSMNLYLKAAKGKDVDEPGDLDKKIAVLKKKLNNTGSAKLEKNETNIFSALTQSIVPMLEICFSQFQKFDDFFRDRTTQVRFKNHTISGSATGLIGFIDAINEYHFFDNVDINILWKSLRHAPTDDVGVSLSFSIRFLKFIYQIECPSNNMKIDKNYNEVFTDKESHEIGEQMGNVVLKTIEINLES